MSHQRVSGFPEREGLTSGEVPELPGNFRGSLGTSGELLDRS